MNRAKRLKKFENRVSDLNFTVETEIRSAVKKAVQKAKSELIFKYNDSTIVNEDDVKALMRSKIEKSELFDYLDTKSNIKDTQANMHAIDILHKQLKHLCVIIIEILRQEVSKYTSNGDTILSKQNKLLTTMYQSISIAKWINQFDPEKADSDEIIFPKNLQNYQDIISNNLDDITDLALTKKNDFERK